jgi:HEAT repeat protein
VYGALAKFDEGEAVPALIGALEGDELVLRESALAALQGICGIALQADPAAWRTWFAAEENWFRTERISDGERLLSLEPARVAEVLRAYSERRLFRSVLAADIQYLLERPESGLRELTCRILGGLGSRAALSDLLDALEDPHPGVARAAHEALQAIQGAPVPRESDRARALLGFDS